MRLLVTLLLLTAAASAADLYPVSGTVINNETGRPFGGAHVAIRPQDRPNADPKVLVAGPDGRFAFDLPAGTYDLHAGPRSAMEVYGQRTSRSPIATGVIVGPNLDTAHIVFRWLPLGAIFGTIVDSNGDPVENALVQLVILRTNGGRRTAQTFRWERTDDRGEYRFGSIVGGTYYVAVTAQPWYAARAFSPGNSESASVAYAPVYYPNAATPGQAEPLVLKAGGEAQADFALHTVTGATIAVEFEPERPSVGNVSLIQDGILGTDGFDREQAVGRVSRFTAVPPGRYLLRFNGNASKGPATASQIVDVNGSDLHVKLSLRAPPRASGVVEWTGAAPRPRGTLYIGLWAEKPSMPGATAIVRPDGTFTLPPVVPGRYRVGVRLGAAIIRATVRAEGVPMRDGFLDLSEDDTPTLRITADSSTGAVRGYVQHEGKPIDSVWVILAPPGESPDWLNYRAYQTDSDGSFNFATVPTGDYLLFAVDDPDLEFTNPTAIRPYLISAHPAHIEAGKLIDDRLDILPTVR
ncbi:MAG TPA: carboxypeptidase regulatory-like domain-containing protein [Candidatus Limnocylindrales bacterium]|nr:carboxypeptidase regulatory-like domain-containing protein [Candidatus Limnocylindrales bacterium]